MWVSAGIDFGNKNIVLAIPRNGGVDVIPSSAGSRLIPAVVCYSGDRRYFGDQAVEHEKMYIKTTIKQLKLLVSLPFNSKEREEISSITAFRLAKLEDGMTGIEIQFHEETLIIRPEQCIAYLLKQIDKMAVQAQNSINEYVIAVSPWWPEKQRRSLLSACKIANMNCMTLINSTTAAAIAYCKIHSDRLPVDSPVPICFIDFGNSSMNVAIALVKQGSVNIKSFADDATIGGSNFTISLLNYLLEKVKNTYKIDPTTNPRAMVNFRNAVEKLKKTLSINTIVQFELPNLMNDMDVRFQVKRDEFNDQILDLISKITAPIDTALEKAGIKKEDLFAVEFLGGGSRVEAVKKTITDYFGKEPKCSLNLDECFAIGSAYMAALLNPQTRVNLSVKDVSPYSVEAQWIEQEETKTTELFPQFAVVPSTATLELNITASQEVQIITNGDVIWSVLIETGIEEAVDVQLIVKLTQSSTTEIETASFKYEGKEKAAKVTVIDKVSLSDEEIDKFRKLEELFDEADQTADRIEFLKNDLQSYYFKLLNMLRDDNEFIPDDQIKEAEEKTQQIIDWYNENEFESLPVEEYETQINSIKQVGDPIIKRVNLLKTNKNDVLPQLQSRIDEIIQNTQNKEEFAKIENDAEQQSQQIKQILENMKDIPSDFDFNDLSKKVSFTEGEYKAVKQQLDLRAKKIQEDEELQRRRKLQNQEEEMRRRIRNQELQRQQAENEEDEYLDPFMSLFGQPMRKRQQPLKRKQYDPEEIERKRREEIEREREQQMEAERRAELQRRAEEQRRQQLLAEQRRRQMEQWGYQDDSSNNSNQYYDEQSDEEVYNPFAQFFGLPGDQQRRLQQQRRQQQQEQLRRQQQQEQLRRQQEEELRRQQWGRAQQQDDPRRQRQRYQDDSPYAQYERPQSVFSNWGETPDPYGRIPQRQRYVNGWDDPYSQINDAPTPRPQPRRRVQPSQVRQPRVSDVWGDPWANMGWRDPFF